MRDPLDPPTLFRGGTHTRKTKKQKRGGGWEAGGNGSNPPMGDLWIGDPARSAVIPTASIKSKDLRRLGGVFCSGGGWDMTLLNLPSFGYRFGLSSGGYLPRRLKSKSNPSTPPAEVYPIAVSFRGTWFMPKGPLLIP